MSGSPFDVTGDLPSASPGKGGPNTLPNSDLDPADVETLKRAAAIIEVELMEGRAVVFPSIGKLYPSEILVSLDHPLADTWGGPSFKQFTVRFRPWRRLLDKINPGRSERRAEAKAKSDARRHRHLDRRILEL